MSDFDFSGNKSPSDVWDSHSNPLPSSDGALEAALSEWKFGQGEGLPKVSPTTSTSNHLYDEKRLKDDCVLETKNVFLDFKKLDRLVDDIREFQDGGGSVQGVEMEGCNVVDLDKSDTELMTMLHKLISLVSKSLESVSFHGSMVSGRVFCKGREALVEASEQVSVEGHAADGTPIVRDDDPQLRVKKSRVQYQYVNTTFSRAKGFRRYYVILDWLQRLRHVDVSKTPISGDGVTALAAASCSSLKTLNLKNCNLVDDRAMYSVVALCNSLESLDISGCKSLSRHVILHIADLPPAQVKQLKFLGVKHTCQPIPYPEPLDGDSHAIAEIEESSPIYDDSWIVHLALLRALQAKGFQGTLACEGRHSSRDTREGKQGDDREAIGSTNGGLENETKTKSPKAKSGGNLISALEFLRGDSDGKESKTHKKTRRRSSGGIGARKFWEDLIVRPLSEDYPPALTRDKLRIFDLSQRDITDKVLRLDTRDGVTRARLRLKDQFINDSVLKPILEVLGDSLTSLDLSGTYITETGLGYLANCPSITDLGLREIRNVTIKQRANRALMPVLAKMDNLTRLRIDGTRISGRALCMHKRLRLKELSAARCPISYYALMMLRDMCGETLESLSLSGCSYLNEECLEVIASLRHLRELDLSNCQGLKANDLMVLRKQIVWYRMRRLDLKGIRFVDKTLVDMLQAAFAKKRMRVSIAISSSSSQNASPMSETHVASAGSLSRQDSPDAKRQTSTVSGMSTSSGSQRESSQTQAQGVGGGDTFLTQFAYMPVHQIPMAATSVSTQARFVGHKPPQTHPSPSIPKTKSDPSNNKKMAINSAADAYARLVQGDMGAKNKNEAANRVSGRVAPAVGAKHQYHLLSAKDCEGSRQNTTFSNPDLHRIENTAAAPLRPGPREDLYSRLTRYDIASGTPQPSGASRTASSPVKTQRDVDVRELEHQTKMNYNTLSSKDMS
ncbi:hypothetical protein AAMO2058_001012500 [Amorphochlora amoebiformis]